MSSPERTPATTTGTDVAEVVPDQVREAVAGEFRGLLGDAVVGEHRLPGKDLWLRVATGSWPAAAEAARSLGFDTFTFLSAIDWLPSPYGRGEDDPTAPPPERSAVIEQGYAGGETRFQVFARLWSIRRKVGVTLKADVPDDDPRIGTWVPVYAGADWHERETFEMFGIVFDGHPGLRKLYLPGDFEGHPLRKDFPLLARMVKPWPGIVDVEPMPAGAGDEAEGDGA